MIADVLAVILAIAVMLATLIVAPSRGACPRGWRLVELHESGSYECHRNLLGDTNDAPEPPGVIFGHVVCTGGSVPIIDAQNIVGCQRGRW